MIEVNNFRRFSEIEDVELKINTKSFLGGETIEYSLDFFINELKVFYKLIQRRSFTVSSNNNIFYFKCYVNLINYPYEYKVVNKKYKFLFKKKYKILFSNYNELNELNIINHFFSLNRGFFEVKNNKLLIEIDNITIDSLEVVKKLIIKLNEAK